MMGCSKMTETLQKDVVQMKAEGMTLPVIVREAGHSISVISKFLQLYNYTNSFNFPKKAGHPSKTQEDRIMHILLKGNRFNTTAGIAWHFSNEWGMDLSQQVLEKSD